MMHSACTETYTPTPIFEGEEHEVEESLV